MSLDAEQVRWVAHLARLELSDPELGTLGRHLGAILDYVDQLNQANTDGVEELAHPLPISNVFRPDEIHPGLTPDQALANAPSRQGDFFGVPAVLD